ncbi:MAG: nucleotidyltransferase family protein [Marinilabiliales bacterium]|nr:MAG: nucleotidyltransferase family protein [Marinilabiliales bacterium]
MKAMIYTGGLESSMKPQSSGRPRALIEINREPLLGMLLRRLADKGFDEIIVNVHHFARQIYEFISLKDFGDIRIELSDETDLVLDSGGGLKKVARFFDDARPFLLYYLEVLSETDPALMYENHLRSGALVTLLVRERESSRYMLFDDNMRLCGWQNTETGEEVIFADHRGNLKKYAFSRIQVLSPAIFNLMPCKDVFSLVDIYLQLARRHLIRGYIDNESIWMDLARAEGVIEAEKLFRKN